MSLSWKALLGRTAAVSGLAGLMVALGVVVGVRIAKADPGGPTRGDLTFAGVLPERAGDPTTRLTFVFRRGTSTTAACTVTTAMFEPRPGGAFAVPVPLDGCRDSRGLFDGENIFYDVRLGDASGPVIAPNVAVTPVPYARFADQVSVNNDCPMGFELSPPDTYWTTASGRRLCLRYLDSSRTIAEEVVRVGRGASAFWIDRFESSVYGQLNGSGPNFGAVGDDYGAGFPDNGRWTDGGEHYALSIQLPVSTGVPNPNAPARYITWFQANAACRLAGKRLPTGDEWLMAAQGTPDPGSSPGTDGACRTAMGGRNGTDAREAGQSSICRSRWGAHDMIGNLAEWTADWFAAPGLPETPAVPLRVATWPDEGFGDDGTFNISPSSGARTRSSNGAGLPAAALRGGAFNGGDTAGTYEIELSESPAYSGPSLGFRCVVPR